MIPTLEWTPEGVSFLDQTKLPHEETYVLARDYNEVARVIRSGRISTKTVESYAPALAKFNSQVRRLAITNPRVALVDFDLLTRLANLASRERMKLAGQKLDRTQGGNDLNHLFLADGRHLGVFGQAVLAQMIVTSLDAKFAAGMQDAEIERGEAAAFQQRDGERIAERELHQRGRGRRHIVWAGLARLRQDQCDIGGLGQGGVGAGGQRDQPDAVTARIVDEVLQFGGLARP